MRARHDRDSDPSSHGCEPQRSTTALFRYLNYLGMIFSRRSRAHWCVLILGWPTEILEDSGILNDPEQQPSLHVPSYLEVYTNAKLLIEKVIGQVVLMSFFIA